MKQLVKGQRCKLSDVTPALELQVGIALRSAGAAVFDFSCFGLDAGSRMSDESYFIFYNQPESPCGALRMTGPREGANEVFQVQLARLPGHIRRLAFTATIDGTGTMEQISSGYLKLSAGGQEVARYSFTGADFHIEKALIVGEIYFKDVWRVAAVGQGFHDSLAGLVRHFGGEVAEDQPAPPPVPVPPPLPPAPTPPPGPEIYVQPDNLQKMIDDAPPGAVLNLRPAEYEGPITVHKALTIEGRGSTIWGRQGPVLLVTRPGVVLRNLEVQVTMPESGYKVALSVAETLEIQLDNVTVRGNTTGLGDDHGDWELPAALDLGKLKPHVDNQARLSLCVPAACKLTTAIEGLTLTPHKLTPGRHEIAVTASEIMPDTLLFGEIRVLTARLTRIIRVTGRT